MKSEFRWIEIFQIDRTCLDMFSRKSPCVDTQIWRPIYVIYLYIYIYVDKIWTGNDW